MRTAAVRDQYQRGTIRLTVGQDEYQIEVHFSPGDESFEIILEMVRDGVEQEEPASVQAWRRRVESGALS